MDFLSPQRLLEIQNLRTATKFFDQNRLVEDHLWAALEESLRLTPSSYNLQPWRFVVVVNDELKKTLRGYAFNQDQITDCSHLVVICARRTLDMEWIDQIIKLTASHTNASVESLEGHRMLIRDDILGVRHHEIPEMNIRQCYIALGNLLTSAALLGLDSCPIEGFIPSQFDDVLGLTGSDWKSTILCAVGYRKIANKYGQTKVRFALENIIDRRE